MNLQLARAIKSVLVWLMLGTVIVCTSVSVLGIWDVIETRDAVWRAMATLGVVFFGSMISFVVLALSQTKLLNGQGSS